MALVSIIMPVYNAGLYLRHAIESILSQTFRDFEMIVVDDCSTDNSYDIICEYANKDCRLHVLQLSENSGNCKVPRDTAITQVTTPWVCPIDADDYIAKDALEKLYRRMIEIGKDETDIVLPRMAFFREKELIFMNIPDENFNMSSVLTGKDAAAKTIGKWEIGFNGAFIRRSLYLDLPMPTGDTPAFIDEYDTRRMLLRARKVGFADTTYFYRQNQHSITQSVSPRLFDTLKLDALLEQLVAENYGKDSYTYTKMEFQIFKHLLFKKIQYYRFRKYLPAVSQIAIPYEFECTYLRIERQRVKKMYPWYQRIFLFSGYSLFSVSAKFYTILKYRGK